MSKIDGFMWQLLGIFYIHKFVNAIGSECDLFPWEKYSPLHKITWNMRYLLPSAQLSQREKFLSQSNSRETKPFGLVI